MLFMAAPVIKVVATYTHPTQMMTLLLLIAGVALCELKGRAGWTVAGALGAMSLVSKIQVIGIVLLLVVRAAGLSLNWLRLLWQAVRGIAGAAAVLGLVVVVDGPDQIVLTLSVPQ